MVMVCCTYATRKITVFKCFEMDVYSAFQPADPLNLLQVKLHHMHASTPKLYSSVHAHLKFILTTWLHFDTLRLQVVLSLNSNVSYQTHCSYWDQRMQCTVHVRDFSMLNSAATLIL